MVVGEDSCSEGHGFKSQDNILDGHFSHIFVLKSVTFVGKDEHKQKRCWGWHIFIKRTIFHLPTLHRLCC